MGWKNIIKNVVVGQGGSVTINGQTITGGSGAAIQGKGPVVEQVREGLDGFDKINMSSMCELTIVVGESVETVTPEVEKQPGGSYREPAGGTENHDYRVVVSAQENIQPVVKTVVRGNTLHIDTKGSYSSQESIEITVHLPRLTALDSSGHGAVRATGIHGPTLTVDHSGMGELRMEGTVDHLAADLSGHGKATFSGFHTEKTVLNHSGMGTVTVIGSTQSLVAFLSGHGTIDLAEVPTPWLHLMASGMGSVRVHCTGAAKGHISGHGSTYVYGNPTDWKVSHDGMGSVKFK